MLDYIYYTTPQAKKQAGNAGDRQHMLKYSQESYPAITFILFYPAHNQQVGEIIFGYLAIMGTANECELFSVFSKK